MEKDRKDVIVRERRIWKRPTLQKRECRSEWWCLEIKTLKPYVRHAKGANEGSGKHDEYRAVRLSEMRREGKVR